MNFAASFTNIIISTERVENGSDEKEEERECSSSHGREEPASVELAFLATIGKTDELGEGYGGTICRVSFLL